MPAPKQSHTPDPRIAELVAQVALNSPKIAALETGIAHMHECVEALKGDVKENIRIALSIAQNAERAAAAAETVRDVQATFKVTLAIGKWVAAIGAAVAGVIAAVKGWRA